MDFGLPIGELALMLAMLLGGGLIMGLLAGLLGIGGGGIMVPILYELFSVIGVDEAVLMHLCVGTSLAVIMPTSLRSFFSHKAKGAVDMDIIRSMALPVVAGVVIGTLVARYANSTILTAIWVGAATMPSRHVAGTAGRSHLETRSRCFEAAAIDCAMLPISEREIPMSFSIWSLRRLSAW